jgi:hypothetical protein
MRFAARLGLCLVLAWPAAARNLEFEALQAHFEPAANARFETLFAGIGSVAQREQRKQATRAALQRMLWHDLHWPATPPPARVTGRLDAGEVPTPSATLRNPTRRSPR